MSFRFDPATVLNMHLSEFLDRSDLAAAFERSYGCGASSRTTPIEFTGWPEEGWVLGEDFGAGRELLHLTRLDPWSVEVSEDTGALKWADVERYAQWMTREGLCPPPVDVIETDTGRLKLSNGHRRAHACKLGDSALPALVSYSVLDERGYVAPLTIELLRQGCRPVAQPQSAREEYVIFPDDRKRLERSRAQFETQTPVYP